MTKVEQARDLFNSNQTKSRSQIIALIMSATESGEAYSSTLYNKARKMSLGTTTKSGNKEAFAALGKKLAVDESKASFIKNCHKVQGLKAGHYNHTFEYAHKSVTITGVTKNGDLVCVKEGTKTRVNVDTRKAMEDLRKIKFLGKK
jgi:flagellar basal body L-ring protein FlgH